MNTTMMSPIGFCSTWHQSHNYSACYNEHANSLQIVCLYICNKVVLVIKILTASAEGIRDMDLILGSGRSPEGGQGNPLQHSFLENPLDRGGWWATVYRITKIWT